MWVHAVQIHGGGTNQATLSDLEQQEKERVFFLFPWFDISERKPLPRSQAGIGSVQPETLTTDCAQLGTWNLDCFPGTNVIFSFSE